MTTGKLNPCMHCGEFVSSLAAICPNCRTDRPNGVACRICGGRLRLEDALRVQGDSGYHRHCLAPQFAFINLSCPLCDRALTHQHVSFDKLLKNPLPDCPHCGHPNVLQSIGHCDRCELPISKVFGHENAASYGSTSRNHEFCLQPELSAPGGAIIRMANLPLLATLTIIAAAGYGIYLVIRATLGS